MGKGPRSVGGAMKRYRVDYSSQDAEWTHFVYCKTLIEAMEVGMALVPRRPDFYAFSAREVPNE